MRRDQLKVTEEDAGLRIDVFLTKRLAECPSRTFVKHLIDAGHVRLNGKGMKPHAKVFAGDEVDVETPAATQQDTRILPENIPLDIFYEDQSLVVINKPAGMLVHPVPGVYAGTLVNALLFHCAVLSDVNEDSIRPGIVHRLDRETSGLIVAAKDNRTHVNLSRQFEKHKIKKRYVAVVEGDVQFDEGKIDAPLGRHTKHFDKKTVSYAEDARDAVTFYRVMRRFGPQATLVALFPQSGRTHQLRVHMAHLGHPILGDDKYGKAGSFPRLALHARGLGFTHPATKEWLECSIPIPREFSNFFSK